MTVGFDRKEVVRGTQNAINQAVSRGTGLIADRVEHYANVARDVGGMLRERGEPQAGELVEYLSSRANDAANYLRNNDPQQVLADVQDATRGRTWIVAGAGFLSGLAIARAVRTAVTDEVDDNERAPAAY
jgi:hypothetical protein